MEGRDENEGGGWEEEGEGGGKEDGEGGRGGRKRGIYMR